jgi:D-beta-D-heptose 7-phosphate kinase/D-beta-D-heptose 1-phosphate adenosyltransferase
LLAALAPDISLSGADKVVSREELATRVATWRANGEKVIFTNGCFDLLHAGHIAFLEEARRAGDRLIVAINNDASVRAVKGAGRPVAGERDRARVIAALSAVDAVVVFADPTPLELILSTRPDLIVKGADYSVDTVVGAAQVLSWGGQVKIIPTLPVHV